MAHRRVKTHQYAFYLLLVAMKFMFVNLLILPLSLLVGCASSQVYRGQTVDCDQVPMPGVEVEAWRNQWRPFALPRSLGSSVTDHQGQFSLETKRAASFFTFGAPSLEMESHSGFSESQCNLQASRN